MVLGPLSRPQGVPCVRASYQFPKCSHLIGQSSHDCVLPPVHTVQRHCAAYHVHVKWMVGSDHPLVMHVIENTHMHLLWICRTDTFSFVKSALENWMGSTASRTFFAAERDHDALVVMIEIL